MAAVAVPSRSVPSLAHSFISSAMQAVLGGMTPVASGVFLLFTVTVAKCPPHQLCSSTGLATPNCILLATSVVKCTASLAAWNCRAVWFKDFSYSPSVQCGLTWAFSRNSIALHISRGTSPLLCQLGPCKLLTAVERWLHASCSLCSRLCFPGWAAFKVFLSVGFGLGFFCFIFLQKELRWLTLHLWFTVIIRSFSERL